MRSESLPSVKIDPIEKLIILPDPSNITEVLCLIKIARSIKCFVLDLTFVVEIAVCICDYMRENRVW